jgi:hypothetical protein
LRRIELVSNQGEILDFKIAIDPDVCEISTGPSKSEKREYERESPTKVQEFFGKATKDELAGGWKGAGKCLFRLGFSISVEGGRAMARAWGAQNLILREVTGQIVPGSAFEYWKQNNGKSVT